MVVGTTIHDTEVAVVELLFMITITMVELLFMITITMVELLFMITITMVELLFMITILEKRRIKKILNLIKHLQLTKALQVKFTPKGLYRKSSTYQLVR